MKRMKKFLAVLLATIMVMSMGTSVFALDQANSGKVTSTDDAKTLTISGVTTSNHIFTAYQIFTGTLSNSGSNNTPVYVLSDIVWGDCVKDSDFLSALKGSTNSALSDSSNSNANYFASCSTAADVAKVLTEQKSNEDLLSAFIALLTAKNSTSGEYLYLSAYSGVSGDSSNTGAESETGVTYKYTIEKLEMGYYLVTDSLVSDTGTSTTYDTTVSETFLQVLGNTTATYKPYTPTVDKEITSSNLVGSSGDEGYGETNTASLGDTVTYKITVTVPNDITGYDKYYMQIKDTLETGLTFVSISNITVTASAAGSTAVSIYNSSSSAISSSVTSGKVTLDTSGATSSGGGSFTLTFSDLLTTAYTTDTNYDSVYFTGGETITITYTATLNSNAVVGTSDGNTNTVNLTYSNDPNSSGTGTATPATTETYTTQLTITKQGDDTSSTKLTGAEFTIYEETTDTYTVNGTNDTDCSSSGNTYYIYVNGTMYDLSSSTTISSLNLTSGYEYTVYKKITSALTTDSSSVYTDAVLKDLGAGTYILIETQTPTGYNTMKPLEVTITYDATNGFTMTYKVYGSTEGGTTVDDDDSGLISMTITNYAGSTLPTTGGMGTTILYIIGVILVLGAGVILITRRRMANK